MQGESFMSSNIILGIFVIAVGVYGIVFNKYPGKEISYENAKRNIKQ